MEKAKLSKSAMLALAALASDELLVIATLRNDGGDDWRAEVSRRESMPRFAVPIRTFRKMRRDDLITKDREWFVTSGLIHSEYTLSEAGRKAFQEPTP